MVRKIVFLKNLGKHISEKFAKDFFNVESIKDEHEFNNLLAKRFSDNGYSVEREKILGSTMRKLDLYVETDNYNIVIETKDTRDKRRTGEEISLNKFFKKVLEGQKQLNVYRDLISNYWEFKDWNVDCYCLCLLVEDDIINLDILNKGVTPLIYDNICFLKQENNQLIFTDSTRIKELK